MTEGLKSHPTEQDVMEKIHEVVEEAAQLGYHKGFFAGLNATVWGMLVAWLFLFAWGLNESRLIVLIAFSLSCATLVVRRLEKKGMVRNEQILKVPLNVDEAPPRNEVL